MKLLNITLYVFFALFLISTLAYAQDGNISVNVQKIESKASLITITAMAVIFVILFVILIIFLKHIIFEKKKRKALKEKVTKMDKDEAEYFRENAADEEEKPAFSVDDDVDRYLKEEERKVVNILRQRDGICSQGTLRIAGNFSKATLSRLLKELEERNIIKKEKRGKKNLVILR